MSNSRITNGSHPKSGVAHAYDNYYGKDKTGPYYEFDYGEFTTFAASGNGGIWCSVLDLAKYETAIKKNLFLSESLTNTSRTAFQSKNWSGDKAHNIGYSWFTGEQSLLNKQSDFGVDFIYHTGSQGGFRSYYVAIPEKDILIVGLFNRPLDDFRQTLFDMLTLIEKNKWLE